MRESKIFEDLLERVEKIVPFEGGEIFLHCWIMKLPFTLDVFKGFEHYNLYLFCTEACPFSQMYFIASTLLQI